MMNSANVTSMRQRIFPCFAQPVSIIAVTRIPV
jgi:hypothetical protein